ncbi:similar to Saccharomyces cerevisiae YIL056W VHR1 Transcriptional activator [Maudiozyma barnettii]|uniref:Similar to Saccharomyces cerevisiae YIL056W VHR1 Transcriptional activator n=1 Tax=Maudiozyma barnettii TaxID=61262 RepID=A0A8H2VBJ8_9SACH|nr:uncharacterized protein KABA2_01S09328 [Kazachstania barnettii]CAB4252247.1 similar to Saccharomyces cerevisiae YIL056W VHR1 Transcriptional activator [Kazachstania barnettii]CAD1778913.1 similar to Saccharomyces cerevisiae YIL056W VHR1 Transcriptional activator [Kazachstania barnettii]
MTTNRKENKQSITSTKDIRKVLKFYDEATWKRFSGRRYQLIDTFGLKDEIASEQDGKISQVANILRTEFSYPLSTTEYFERLVMAAIQCVRRNMKRSLKRQVNKISKQASHSISKSTRVSVRRIIQTQNNINKVEEKGNVPKKEIVEQVGTLNNDEDDLFVISNVLSDDPSVDVPSKKTEIKESPEVYDIEYDSIIKSVLSDIINETVPFSEQESNASHKEPDLSNFLTNCERDMESLIATKTKSEIPFSLKEKLLHSIEKSKTCSAIAKSHNSLNKFNILCNLGKSSYNTALNFIIEKFTQNQVDTLEILYDKASTDRFISDLSRQLFSTATKINLSVSLSDIALIRLFVITVGALIKDFGFDPILYPLSEMIMQHIMINYPLNKPKSTVTSRSQRISNNQHTILMTLPIDPQLANKEVYRTVTIKYGPKEQDFRFPLLSNGPPTIQEILKNCRILFNISQLNKTSFALFNENGLISDDDHLSHLFSEIQSGSLTLVIKPTDQV